MYIHVIYISMCNNMYKAILIYCVTLRYSGLTKYKIIYAEGCSGLHFGFSLAFKGNKYVVFVNCCDFEVQTFCLHFVLFVLFSYFWQLKTLVLPERMLKKELGRSRRIQRRIKSVVEYRRWNFFLK